MFPRIIMREFEPALLFNRFKYAYIFTSYLVNKNKVYFYSLKIQEEHNKYC